MRAVPSGQSEATLNLCEYARGSGPGQSEADRARDSALPDPVVVTPQNLRAQSQPRR